jgi:hypothetical protein
MEVQPNLKNVPLVVPYAGAARLTHYWAMGEQQIDWQKNGGDAERCTVAFAATELQKYLALSFPNTEFEFRETLPAEGPAIVVSPLKTIQRVYTSTAGLAPLVDRQSYLIQSHETGGRPTLLLSGGGREGALYAVYAYLQELGWRWYAPGDAGEIPPEITPDLRLDSWNIHEIPDFPFFRGFHAYPTSMESRQMFLWMVRNRLNLWAYKPDCYAFMKKLGFRLMTGGHIMEEILDPDKPLPSGKTLYEEHPEWFAEVDGKRERKNASRYQFCVSNAAAVEFASSAVVQHLKTDWQWTDIQNIYVFDTWAGWCQCSRCQALGNDADRYMHLLAAVRRAVQQAQASGELKHDTGLDLNAYEGTPSLEAPSRPLPAELAEGENFVSYAPINRCYAHTLADPRCTELNEHYARSMTDWGRTTDRFPLTVMEYYNVSKFEDLPLQFSRTLGPDFEFYHRIGVKGVSYMALPMSLWGPRALTQILYARLCWNSHAPVEEIRDEYLRRFYGPAAAPMHEFYDSLESAYANITAWRSWLHTSVNTNLLHWDGERPSKPLFRFKHLQPEGGEAIGPQESLALLTQAGGELDLALKMNVPLPIRLRLEEDARQFRYGDDSFRFYDAMARLYEADRHGDSAALGASWRDVQRFAESLHSYVVPFSWEDPGPGFAAKDGLQRTQLRALYETLRRRFAKTP